MIKHSFQWVSLVIVASIAAACAHSSGANTAGANTAGANTAGGPKRDRNLISAEELATIQAVNVYQAIERARPEWLLRRQTASLTGGSTQGAAARGSGSARGSAGADTSGASGGPIPMPPAGDLQVFIDRLPSGTVEALKQVNLAGVKAVRFFTASQANGRFGSGAPNGAIQVFITLDP